MLVLHVSSHQQAIKRAMWAYLGNELLRCEHIYCGSQKNNWCTTYSSPQVSSHQQAIKRAMWAYLGNELLRCEHIYCESQKNNWTHKLTNLTQYNYGVAVLVSSSHSPDVDTLCWHMSAYVSILICWHICRHLNMSAYSSAFQKCVDTYVGIFPTTRRICRYLNVPALMSAS